MKANSCRSAKFAAFASAVMLAMPAGISIMDSSMAADLDFTGTIQSIDQAKYKNTVTLRNGPGVDWVVAECGNANERAISGLCTIDSEEGWGWVLQNAGVISPTQWGCAYRRSTFVSNQGLGEDPDNQYPAFSIFGPIRTQEIFAAANTAQASASALCISVN